MDKLRLLLIIFLTNPFQNTVKANNYFGSKNIANLKQQYIQQKSSKEKEEKCFKEKVSQSWEGKYHWDNYAAEPFIRFSGGSTILVYQDRVERWSRRYPDYKCKVDVFSYGKPYYYPKNEGRVKGYGPSSYFECDYQTIYKVVFEYDNNNLIAYQIMEYPFTTRTVDKVNANTAYFAKILAKDWNFDSRCKYHKENKDQSWDISIGDVVRK